MSITTDAPTGYAIERIEPLTASDELAARLVAFEQAVEHERIPEDPPPPAETILAHLRATSPFFERRLWAAYGGDEIVGGAFLGIDKSGSNPNHRQVEVDVLPQHRGRGLGRALFATAIEEIGEGDDVIVNFWTSDRSAAGEAFLAHVGAEPKLRMKMNQLDLKTIDRGRMASWARLDPLGYRLEWIDGDAPERLLPNVITAWETMNSMPREGLDMKDWKVTPEIVRDRERMRKERGQERRLVLAIDEATGGTASFTELFFDPRAAHVIWQGGTATVPAHRGKGLGKWVKGRMILRVLDEMPRALFVRTNNAGSNAPMLAINEQMGFRVVWQNTAWQMPLSRAREYVGR